MISLAIQSLLGAFIVLSVMLLVLYGIWKLANVVDDKFGHKAGMSVFIIALFLLLALQLFLSGLSGGATP